MMPRAASLTLTILQLHPFKSFEKLLSAVRQSSKNPHFQNEARCTTLSRENEFYLHENEK